MTKFITATLLILSAATSTAQPDKDWWACQFVESAGMEWDGRKWEVLPFNLPGPFTLISDGEGSLTRESAAKAMAMAEFARLVKCDEAFGGIAYCVGSGTTVLSFSLQEGLGTVAMLAGGTQPKGKRRDTPVIKVFECSQG